MKNALTCLHLVNAGQAISSFSDDRAIDPTHELGTVRTPRTHLPSLLEGFAVHKKTRDEWMMRVKQSP